jgi:hypothetical protein
MIVVMGVYPQPFLRRMEPAVQEYVTRIQRKMADAPSDQARTLARAGVEFGRGEAP